MKTNLKIDIVIPWVDGNDPKWNEIRQYYSGQKEPTSARYRDYGLMKYWFRMIETNMPWINNIFFITCGHLPQWLNIESPKLKIIKHTDYIPQEYLPTFSSHVIEMNLHRIKDLSNAFIYMNDDTYITSKVDPDYFFSKSGLPKQMLVIKDIWNYDLSSDFPYFDFNNVGMINKHFSGSKSNYHLLFHYKYGIKNNLKNTKMLFSNIYPGFVQSHMPCPFLKETFTDIWAKEEIYMDAVCHHRFRQYKDVNQWLAQYWQMAKGCFVPTNNTKSQKMFVIGEDTDQIISAIENSKYIEICINDNENMENIDSDLNQIKNTFQKKYSQKSSFEL